MSQEHPQKTILLVDDDRTLHALQGFALKKNGYRMYSAYDGREGLDMALEIMPDLILVDYMMPRFTGGDFIRAIRTDERYRTLQSIPVIMLTAAEHDESVIRKMMEDGLSSYLNKPFGHHELLSILQSTLFESEKKVREHRMLAELQSNQAFFTTLLDNFPGLLFTTDTAGKITYLTTGKSNLSDGEKVDVADKTIVDLFSFEHSTIQSLLETLKTGEKTLITEAAFLAGPESRIPVELHVTLLHNDDLEILGLLGIARDLRAVKQLETEKLERERVTAIAQALATVNHEINNPLMPILGNVQLLQDELSGMPADVTEKLESIRSSAERIGESVRKMSTISQPILKEYYNGQMIIDLEKSS